MGWYLHDTDNKGWRSLKRDGGCADLGTVYGLPQYRPEIHRDTFQ